MLIFAATRWLLVGKSGMDWRLQKQLFITFIFFSLILFFGILFLLRSGSQPTCFDNIQNQDEQEVDCGGPCVPCSIKKLTPLEINYIEVLKTSEVKKGILPEYTYDIVARVRNINVNWGARKIYYKLNVFDEFSNSLGTIPGQTFVYPAEVKYLIALNFPSKEKAKRATLDISYDLGSWDVYENVKNPLRVQDQKLDKNIATALVVNESSYSFQNINVYALVVNADRKPIGVGRTFIENLPAFGEKNIQIVLPALLADRPESDYGKGVLEVVPEIYLYDIYSPKR